MQINRNISKAIVLEIADEITIFSKYLDIPERVIIECIETGKLINSPLRVDDNDASVGFKYNNKGKLKCRDFGGYFWGDCFDLVAFELNINVNNKLGFITILKHIYNTITSKNQLKISTATVNRSILKIANATKRVIDIEPREWNIHDRYYWNDFLYKETNIFGYLEEQRIIPISNYWVDKHSQPTAKYYYRTENPAYAFILGEDVNGILNYRIYFPFARKPFPKFITNNSSWQGLINIPDKVDMVVITKANKDRISIISFTKLNKLTIGVIAPPSENHKISSLEYQWLADKVQFRFEDTGLPAIISLYDFDRTGLAGSGYLKRTFGVRRIMFTNGSYGTKVTGGKDFTDSIPMYGKIKFQKLVNNFIDKLKLV